jgi:hypothetical protein
VREFKFRGACLTTGSWVYGGGIDTQRDTPRIINQGNYHPVITETIGQFIGIKDCAGVDIYEGDILTGGSVSGLVKWCSEDCSFWLATSRESGAMLGEDYIRKQNFHVYTGN